MNRPTLPSFIPTLVALLAVLVAGCDNGTPRAGAARSSSGQTRITGHVLDDEGPIGRGRVEAKDARGMTIAKAEMKAQTPYELMIPTGAVYPLILTAYSDAAPDEPMRAAVADANAIEQDISPITTIVVDTALSLGGLTDTNLAKAAGAAIAQRRKSGGGAGGSATSQSFKGDPTKQYGGWH